MARSPHGDAVGLLGAEVVLEADGDVWAALPLLRWLPTERLPGPGAALAAAARAPDAPLPAELRTDFAATIGSQVYGGLDPAYLPPGDAEDWECATCTFKNPPDADCCTVCEAARATSATHGTCPDGSRLRRVATALHWLDTSSADSDSDSAGRPEYRTQAYGLTAAQCLELVLRHSGLPQGVSWRIFEHFVAFFDHQLRGLRRQEVPAPARTRGARGRGQAQRS